MPVIKNSKLTKNAQKLRKEMTEEERKLWYLYLKNFPVKVHRQKVIENFIVDFYIAKAKIVIEIDGSQHFEDELLQKDKERNQSLELLGMQVLRYTNKEVQNEFRSVCEDILHNTQARLPHLRLLS